MFEIIVKLDVEGDPTDEMLENISKAAAVYAEECGRKVWNLRMTWNPLEPKETP